MREKIIYCIVVLSCMNFSLFGQAISANDLLLYATCKSSIEFDHLILKKGFAFYKKERHSSDEEIRYYYYRNDSKFTTDINMNLTSSNSMSIVYVTKSSALRLMTTNKSTYELMMNDFLSLGFEKTNMTAYKGKYTSSKYPDIILWWNSYPVGKEVERLVNYNIYIERKLE